MHLQPLFVKPSRVTDDVKRDELVPIEAFLSAVRRLRCVQAHSSRCCPSSCRALHFGQNRRAVAWCMLLDLTGLL